MQKSSLPTDEFVINVTDELYITLQEYLEEYVGTKTRREILYQVRNIRPINLW